MVDPEGRRYASCASTGSFLIIDTLSGRGLVKIDEEGHHAVLPINSDDQNVGDAISKALAKSRILPPGEAKAFLAPRKGKEEYDARVLRLREALGFKTRRALFENMQLVQIESKDGQIELMPTNHEKLEGWSGDGIDKALHIMLPANADARLLGSSLRIVLARCI